MSARHESEGLKYGVAETEKSTETLNFTASGLGQRNPQHYPHREEPAAACSSAPSPLGDPLSIHDVAELLGCSAWTVRQRYLPQGLPHLRACTSGKLVFFREQVIAWILKRQQQRQKGGQLR
jgi:hypothetical protein